jgi:hypothetical protein
MNVVGSISSSMLFLRDKNKKIVKDGEEISEDGLLCRFVLDGQGRKVGESIAVYKDLLIIKTGKDFLGVPMKHIDVDISHILVKGLIDHTKALELGKGWQKENYKEIKYPPEEP